MHKLKTKNSFCQIKQVWRVQEIYKKKIFLSSIQQNSQLTLCHIFSFFFFFFLFCWIVLLLSTSFHIKRLSRKRSESHKYANLLNSYLVLIYSCFFPSFSAKWLCNFSILCHCFTKKPKVTHAYGFCRIL